MFLKLKIQNIVGHKLFLNNIFPWDFQEGIVQIQGLSTRSFHNGRSFFDLIFGRGLFFGNRFGRTEKRKCSFDFFLERWFLLHLFWIKILSESVILIYIFISGQTSMFCLLFHLSSEHYIPKLWWYSKSSQLPSIVVLVMVPLQFVKVSFLISWRIVVM